MAHQQLSSKLEKIKVRRKGTPMYLMARVIKSMVLKQNKKNTKNKL